MRANTQRIKGLIKSFLGQTTFSSGLHRLLLSDAALVVAFHRVNKTNERDRLTCDVNLFEKYCRFFAEYFHVVSLGHLVKKLETGAPLNRELVITFDDGYRDNYEYAAPLLKAMGLSATFFVVSQFVGTEVVPWWDTRRGVRCPFMNWDQLRHLWSEGFEIGAHSRTHADLGRILTRKAREEILGSRLELEEELSAPVDLFAYPYGAENHITEENRGTVKEAGFRCCCSCFGGINRMATDPFHLRRIPIGSWFESPHHFACEVALRRV